MYRSILYEKKDRIARLTLNRPEVRNAVNETMRQEIILALADAKADGDIAVVVVSASGKSFCSGRDRNEFMNHDGWSMAEVYSDYARGKEFLDVLQYYPKPLIAAVQGFALGYGVSIVTYCDLAVAGQSAVFGYPEINENIIPATAAVKAAETVGRRMLTEMIFLGNRYTADQALAMGLINCVTKDEDILPKAAEWAETMAKNDPTTNQLCKQFIQSVGKTGYDAGALNSVSVLSVSYANNKKWR
ncbi:MAG: enoyl-CoA hydratase/isomerase family protein [Gracilibacteraceae bacterium]|jgi:enoyl-CoA hydratase/carnithine racemase|nr:enoyl-CoA hydratase/isomerase family protein [Gracilibacteraceae bacterium]